MRTARLAAPLLGLLLLFGFLAREGPRRDASPDAPRPIERVTDPESAFAFRRVALALAAGRVAQFDRAARHPEGGDVVDAPVFAAALTGLAALALGDATGRAGASALDEDRLASVLQHVGPALGLLLVLLVHRAAARLGGPAARSRALLAAAQLAIGAPFVAAAALGRLPLGLWTACVACAGLLLSAPLLRDERDDVDRLQSSLLAGLTLGLALAGSPVALAAALPVVATLSVRVLRAEVGEPRRVRARELLLACVPMACLAALPAVGGPWERAAPGSPVARLSHDVPLAILLASAPAWIAFWPAVSRRVSDTRWSVAASVLAAGLVLAVGARLAADLPAPEAARWPASWVVLHGIAVVLAWRDARGAAERAWVACAVLAAGATWFEPRAALLAASAGGVALCVAVWPADAPARRWLAAACVVVLVADVSREFLAHEGRRVRGARQVAVVRALRNLRGATPSPAPWNSTRAPAAWGIAAPPELAPLVLLHARRPVLEAPGRVTGRAGAGAGVAQDAAGSALDSVLGVALDSALDVDADGDVDGARPGRRLWGAVGAERDRLAALAGARYACARPADLAWIASVRPGPPAARPAQDPARGPESAGATPWETLLQGSPGAPAAALHGPRDAAGRAALGILRFGRTSAQNGEASGR